MALKLTSSPGYVFQTAVPSWKCTWLQEQALVVIPLQHSRINMMGPDGARIGASLWSLYVLWGLRVDSFCICKNASYLSPSLNFRSHWFYFKLKKNSKYPVMGNIWVKKMYNSTYAGGQIWDNWCIFRLTFPELNACSASKCTLTLAIEPFFKLVCSEPVLRILSGLWPEVEH